MLGFNFKRSHTEGGGNTAALTLFGFWPRPRGLSKWVLLPIAVDLQHTGPSVCPLSLEKRGKLQAQGTAGVPEAPVVGTSALSPPPPPGSGGRISGSSPREGPRKKWTAGHVHGTSCSSRWGSGFGLHVLPSECLWARRSPSLAASVKWED